MYNYGFCNPNGFSFVVFCFSRQECTVKKNLRNCDPVLSRVGFSMQRLGI